MRLKLVLLAFCLTPCITAQEFEAVSIKSPATPTHRESLSGGPGSTSPGQINYEGVSLATLVRNAYGLRAYEVAGPDWMGRTRFDIVAKVPAGTSKQQFGLMLQKMLADSFALTSHREPRTMDGYELTVAKGGAKLKPTENKPAPELKSPSDGMLVFWLRDEHSGTLRLPNGLSRYFGLIQTMPQLVTLCVNHLRMPVVDKTGLTGIYDYSFDTALDIPPTAASAPISDASDPGPDFLTAFQKQLGLRLEKKKLTVDVVVIDHLEKAPAGN